MKEKIRVFRNNVHKFPLAKICRKVIEMFTIIEYNLLMFMKHKRQGMIL